MTNKIAIPIALMIIALLVVDHYWLHWNIPLFWGRKLAELSEYVAFWR